MTPTEIAKPAITATTNEFLKRTELIWGKTIDSVLERFHDGVLKYLESQQERFLHTKTFLHRDAVPFYSIYFPLRVNKKGSNIAINTFRDIFKVGPRVALIGAAGSGKSTIMRHLFLNVIQKGEYEIPLFIELRRLEKDGNLLSFIEKMSLGSGLVITKTAAEKLLDDGKLMLFLDGFDEVPADAFSSLVQSIDDLRIRYSKTKIVVTGRPGSRVEALQGFHCAQMAELTPSDIRKFVEVQKLGIENESRLLGIIKRISRERKKYLEEYLSNPLLLSLFIITCTTTKQLPDKKSAFYRRVVDTLFVEHDSVSKPDFDRQLKSGLSQDKFEMLLQRFSVVSYFNSKFRFDKTYLATTFPKIFEKSPALTADLHKIAKDLVVGVGLWAEDGGEYSFAHRSLQEYFVGAFIAGLETSKKEEVYKKLWKHICMAELGEVENFLSLCQELDEQAYIRYFLQPILNHLDKLLNEDDAPLVLARLTKMYFGEILVYYPTKSVKAASAIDDRRFSWRTVKESALLGASYVFPELVREFMHYVLFEGLMTRILGQIEPSVALHPPDSTIPSGQSAIYDIGKSVDEVMLVKLASDLPRLTARVDELRVECKTLQDAWKRRLAELDFADSTLIHEML